jgi:hypothetical protein
MKAGMLRCRVKDHLMSRVVQERREGAPDAWFEVNASFAEGLEGIEVGYELIVIT